MKEQTAQCRRMAEGEPNLRVQAILRDMAGTWDRLAIEAEISRRSEPSLRVIPPLPSQASRKPRFAAGFFSERSSARVASVLIPHLHWGR